MSPARRRTSLLAALLLTGPLALAGCSGDQPEADDPGTTAGPSATTTAEAPPPVSPLTGRPMTGAAPRHPVLAVKIDNSGNSAPQIGLGSADMVVEELVEGGITRLAVFYYARVPETVGPVRSMRATDIGIVSPLDATLVASGGAAPTISRVSDAGIRFATEGAPGFFRDGSRSAPYNLFMHLRELAGTLKRTAVPAAYLPFGKGPGKGRPARTLTASFSAGSSSTFELRDGRYVNTDTNAAAGDTFAADTVLVLRVRIGDAGYLDPAGNPVPETIFTGRGPATVFSRGRMVRGTWVKDGLGADLRLVDGRGRPLTLRPGKVWIELVPASGGGLTTAP